MATKTQATRLLRAALADLYATRGDAERVVVDAELKLSAITFSDKALNNWQNILSEAEKHQKMVKIIEVAREEYPAHEALRQASAAYLAPTEGEAAGRGPLEPVGRNDAERQGLRELLAQHRRNRQLLQGKQAVYGAGEEPLSLLNQIEHEEREIARIKKALGE